MLTVHTESSKTSAVIGSATLYSMLERPIFLGVATKKTPWGTLCMGARSSVGLMSG